MGYLGLILGGLGVILLSNLWKKLMVLVWRPYVVTKKLRAQGVMGPQYKFLLGNLEEIRILQIAAMGMVMDVHCHDIVPRVLPHFSKWMHQYGGIFLYWDGTVPSLCISDAELIKQVLANKFGFFPRPEASGPLLSLFGRGLVLTNGEEWARHKRVVSPAFAMDKLKLMIKQMAECTQSMLDGWNQQMLRAGGQYFVVDVGKLFQELTADVISRAIFGSNYVDGKEVFLAQKELEMLFFATAHKISIPGFNYLPTKVNLQKWKLDKRLRTTLGHIIKNRLNSKDSGYCNDLLGLMMESSRKQEGVGLNTNEIMEECKTFFVAGHETTSHLLTWTMFLLSTNLEWQCKLREEVVRECGTKIPNADNLSKLKLVTMVLREALRLYGPVVMIFRVAAEDLKLGGIMIPKGTTVTMPFAVTHRDRRLWGDDAGEFNPLRFENGTTMAAKHPNAMLAFSMGPRACIGQDFAMLEAKTAIAMILQRFSFSLSPEYKHKPAIVLTLQPQDGLPIVLETLVS